jgi:hypothetical protein
MELGECSIDKSLEEEEVEGKTKNGITKVYREWLQRKLV